MDVAPKGKTTLRGRIANLVRQFGDPERGVRVTAWRFLEQAMNGAGINWSDLANWLEDSETLDESKYTEDELQQYGQAQREEGVKIGIKIGEARKSNGSGNGHLMLPKPSDMAEYCYARLNKMKDDAQRDFVRESYRTMQRGRSMQVGSLGYLVSLYMKHGGKFQR
jgi:hypothetical protein